MTDRPSDGMELDELRDEFDWMYEFQSRMAERIRGDADVHSLVDYVGKLEAENAKLREFASEAFSMAFNFYHGAGTAEDLRELTVEYRELGIEVD